MIDHLEDSIIYHKENYVVIPHLMNISRNNTIYFQNENDSINQDNMLSIVEVLNRYPGTKL